MKILALIGATLAAMAVSEASQTFSSHASSAASAPSASVQALVDRAFSGPAGPDDEGAYRLIDPIGPGGATASMAADEVYASTMIGGQYTKWRPYHDPFTTTGGYGQRIDRPGFLP